MSLLKSIFVDNIAGFFIKLIKNPDKNDKVTQGVKNILHSLDYRQVAALAASTPAVSDKPLFKAGVLLLGEALEGIDQKIEDKEKAEAEAKSKEAAPALTADEKKAAKAAEKAAKKAAEEGK